jgi:uncharacterized membrane protein
MVARSESPSWPAERPYVALVAAALAIAALVGTWTVSQHTFYARSEITDLPLYERYGDAMYGKRHVPYRDFRVEYPPAALPAFVIPSFRHYGNPVAYKRTFSALMWICAAAALLFVALALREVRAPPLRIALALAFIVVSPLLLGSVIRLRFDLWPAALTAGAAAAVVAGRARLAGATLGLAVAAKIYPGVLLPLALVYVWRREGRRAAGVFTGVFALVLAVCFVPFLVLAPEGVVRSITTQTSRPLQIETLGASFLLAAHHVFGMHLKMVASHGSQNFVGTTADALATAQTVVQALTLVGLWVAFARGPAHEERFLRYAAAAVCAFIAFGKVLSPQFMIWLIPLVPLVRGRRGVVATALLGVLLVVTQLWFPYHFWNLAQHFRARESWLVLVRDVGLVVLLAVLVYRTKTRSGSHAVARPS